MTDDELIKDYHAAVHAMQSAVAFELEHKGDSSGTPKDLRVGVNICLRDHASLASLLISKGVFTRSEYLEALLVGMQTEVQECTQRIREEIGNHELTFK